MQVKTNKVDLFNIYSYTSEIQVHNSVISNVGGVALDFAHCSQIDLESTVARNVVYEVIKITGDSSNVNIAQTVITGDSQKGRGWMWLEGDFYRISNTVASGAPRNGIVVGFYLRLLYSSAPL